MAFLLHQARFYTTVNHLRDLPPTVQPEIAFAGRSNAGKSTAINVLCNQKRLAFASKTPGRTQHINYFSVGPAAEPVANLVDLPGYGYAEVPGAAKAHWEMLLRARAVENQCYVLAAAQGGKHENGRRTWGHSMLVDPWGELVAVRDEGAGVVAGNLERARIDEVRQSLPAWRHRVLSC